MSGGRTGVLWTGAALAVLGAHVALGLWLIAATPLAPARAASDEGLTFTLDLAADDPAPQAPPAPDVTPDPGPREPPPEPTEPEPATETAPQEAEPPPETDPEPSPVVAPPPPPARPAPKAEARKPPQERPRAPRPEAARHASSPANAAALDPQAFSNWQARLVTHLERRRQYPAAARIRRREGVAQVRFRVASEGSVSGVALVRSSGDADLDREAISLVMRASPLPAPPSGAPVTVTAPVRFSLR